MSKTEIIKILQDIEKEEGLKILFAVEAGSRVWRISSKDSDYDVRFVYCRNQKDYLRLNKLADVIQKQEKDFDFVGFDIYKFAKLMLSSNPSMIEWLKSDIIYMDDGKTKELFKKFIEKKFNPVTLYLHYRSMCKQNYLKYLKSCENMTHKKYLYSMRGLVNSKWVLKYNTIPPINFPITLDVGSELLKKNVWHKLMEIIDLKKDGLEKIKVSKIHLFENYIEDFLKSEEQPESRRIIDYQEIQEHIFDLLS